MKTIVICCSATFYKHANEVADELEKRGYKAVVPYNARQMCNNGNYNAEEYKTWYQNPEDFKKKSDYIRWHFDEVDKGDAVLVVNDEKKGLKGYIGANTLMEMGIAFFQQKPIFVLNPIDKDPPNWEEIVGMGSIMLDGDLSKVKL
jgi:diphthamide synthase subunit DPH2